MRTARGNTIIETALLMALFALVFWLAMPGLQGGARTTVTSDNSLLDQSQILDSETP